MSGRLATRTTPTARAPVIAVLAALTLLLVYGATIAPSVTFWDAGEFIAAAETLGIPHPPGTPLYVLLLSAWSRMLPWVPTALATNVFSAVCTAVACGVGALLVARWTGRAVDGFAAALCAGGTSTVWLNATETEVYAASLALSILTLALAERAGRTGDRRWLMAVAYLIVLAVPLHMSALVAGPAVVYATATGHTGPVRWSHAFVVGGAWLVAMGVGKMSALPTIAGLAAFVAGAVLHARDSGGATKRAARIRRAVAMTGVFVAIAAAAASALLFLLIRAQHDPAVNQGAPSTLAALVDVVARRQYDVAPLWPRRAPWWLQTANIFEYADWQFALSLGTTVIPTVARTATTLVFALLGVIGSVAHRRRDRRSWWILVLLLIGGSLGVVAYLNLRAGPSFGWGVLPGDATREARERDYFFVTGFWVWGLWAGYGAVVAVERLRLPAITGVAIAALPIVLNWRAVDRGRWPDAQLPHFVAISLLEASPTRSVLFVGGDNDTYPLWYAQAVLGVRRDVTVITTPLLPADWYRSELWRRHRLHREARVSGWHGRTPASREIAERARSLGRPVAVAVTMPSDERKSIAERWELRGPVLVEVPRSPVPFGVDTVVTDRWAASFDAWRRGRRAPRAIDPTGQLMLDVLSCPGWNVGRRAAEADERDGSRSLASLCNLR